MEKFSTRKKSMPWCGWRAAAAGPTPNRLRSRMLSSGCAPGGADWARATAGHHFAARGLCAESHSLAGAYLRVVFAATLVSTEHLTYLEFLQRIPETTHLASCRLDPME